MSGGSGQRPRALELFAGAGGLALGLHAAGFEHAALVEFEAKACAMLRHNAHGWRRIRQRDAPWRPDQVVEADVRDYLRSPDAVGGELDLLAGGPPCQPFSLGGVHAGSTDARNMFPAALDYVRAYLPKLVLFENVPGLTRPGFLPYFQYVEDQLRWPTTPPRADEPWTEHHNRVRVRRNGPLGARYRVTRQVINAADLGVPQVRRRVFLMAVRGDVLDEALPPAPLTHTEEALLYTQWVEPSYWEEYGLLPPRLPGRLAPERAQRLKLDGFPEDLRWRTVRDALDVLPEPVDGAADPVFLNHVGVPGARSYKGHTGSELDRPAKTLKAGVHGVCGGEAMIRYPEGHVRYMTVREAATIQGFPLDYEFLGARGHAMRHIGNAVAKEVARVVGGHLRAHAGL